MSKVVSLNGKEFDLIDAQFEQEAYYGPIDDNSFRPVLRGPRSADIVVAEREFDAAARLDDLQFLMQPDLFPVTVFLDDGWTMRFDCWCRVYNPGWLDEGKQFTHEPIDPDFRQIAFAYPPRRRAARLSLMISGNMTATDCRAAPGDGMCDIDDALWVV